MLEYVKILQLRNTNNLETGKVPKQTFSKEGIQMANKDTKRHSEHHQPLGDCISHRGNCTRDRTVSAMLREELTQKEQAGGSLSILLDFL
jgi:hypothetical protein